MERAGRGELAGKMQYCHPQLLQLEDTSLEDVPQTQLGRQLDNPVKNILVAKYIEGKKLKK